jgi:hypothetical protein
MPVAVHITPRNMSRQDYDRVIAQVHPLHPTKPD